MALDVDAVPSHAGYWEGLYRALTRPQTVLPILGRLAQRLAEAPRGDDEDRFLVLLYADNGRAHEVPETGLHQAAAWLRSQRRYILQWKLQLREHPAPRPAWTRGVEAPLLRAVQALRDRACEASLPWELPLLDALLNGRSPAPATQGPTEEVLRRLGCDEGRIQRLRLIHAAYELPSSMGGPAHDPVAEDRERVARLAREALSCCW